MGDIKIVRFCVESEVIPKDTTIIASNVDEDIHYFCYEQDGGVMIPCIAYCFSKPTEAEIQRFYSGMLTSAFLPYESMVVNFYKLGDFSWFDIAMPKQMFFYEKSDFYVLLVDRDTRKVIGQRKMIVNDKLLSDMEKACLDYNSYPDSLPFEDLLEEYHSLPMDSYLKGLKMYDTKLIP